MNLGDTNFAEIGKRNIDDKLDKLMKTNYFVNGGSNSFQRSWELCTRI